MAEGDRSQHLRIRGRGGPRQHIELGGPVSESVDHPVPTASSRADAMKAREEQDTSDVMAGMYPPFCN